MNKVYEVLEVCLQEIEQGADIDTVLFRYPEFADELRPILEASVNARNLMVPDPSAEVARRNRLKVLQHAAQMREAKVRSTRRIWFTSLRRVAVTLTVVAALFVSGTNLVRAASTTVPGDNLYPVKRTWEDVLLLFTFDLQAREALEIEHENERLHELRELFAEGRDEDVDFAGLVTSQNGNEWMVAGIPVLISSQTEIRGQGIVIGSAVRVEGHTQDNGAVLAEEIRLLPPDAKLPDLDDDDDGEKENHEGEDRKEQDNSGKGSDDDEPKIEETKESDSDSEQKDESSLDDSNSGKSDSDSDDGSSESDNSGSGSDDGASEGDNSGSDGGGDD